MELSVGMYVRTKKLLNYDYVMITKIKHIEEKETCLHIWLENKDLITEKYITKASYDIIDLIELGDYVNELPVEAYYTRYDEEKDDYIKIGIITLEDYCKGTFTSVEEIKTIATKEQFSQIQYRIGD